MKLIVGLGNPGTRYQNTRHNLGQNIIEKYVKTHRDASLRVISKFNAKTSEINGCLFAVSTEYMNNSGITVAKIINFYKISPIDLYVIHDDLDLGVGEYKLQFDRGAAGHNGIKSIIDHLGTQAFNRLRVGTGHPRNSTNPNLPVEDYVLLPFTANEKVIINQTIDKIVKDVIPDILGS